MDQSNDMAIVYSSPVTCIPDHKKRRPSKFMRRFSGVNKEEVHLTDKDRSALILKTFQEIIKQNMKLCDLIIKLDTI